MMQMPEALIQQLAFVGQRNRRRGAMQGCGQDGGAAGSGSGPVTRRHCDHTTRRCPVNGTHAGRVAHRPGAQEMVPERGLAAHRVIE